MGGYIGARAGTLSTTVANVQDVTATDTTPEITLKNTTETDADGSRSGKITFKGEQSGGEESTLAQIVASHDTAVDDEAGDLIFKTNDGNDGASPTEAMRIQSDQKIGIGVNDPDADLDISGGSNKLGILRVTQRVSGAAAYGLDVGLDPSTGDPVFSRIVNDTVTEAMRIERSSGNVGIGATPSNSRLYLTGSGFAGQLLVAPTTSAYVGVGHGTDHPAIHWQTGDFRFATSTDSDLTGFSEKMRITNGGQMFLNHSSSIGSGIVTMNMGGTNKTLGIRMRAAAVGNYAMGFENSAGTLVGSVVLNISSTSYNTSSDYRLKENVTDISDGITRVKQLSPKRFNFIADADTTVDGFLAHEAQTVVPEAVTGTKDAMKDEEYTVTAAKGDVYTPATDDADEVVHSSNVEQPETLEDGQQWRETAEAVMGTRSVPDIQGIDQAKIVPLLTAALKEAIAKIEILETKVAALEAE